MFKGGDALSVAERSISLSLYDHDHSHNHAPPPEEDCCSGGECCGANDSGGSGHDHDHAHASPTPKDDCCSSGDECCGANNATNSGSGHDHDHTHTRPNEAVAVVVAAAVVAPLDVHVDVHEGAVCSSCDPESEVAHAIQVTRIRIANLCCAMEERLIHSALASQNGIESVVVNVVGRYAIVKHCPVACCAPTEKIVSLLNAERLGAAVQEAGESSDALDEKVDRLQIAYVTVLMVLLFTGVGLQETTGHQSASSIGVFVTCVVLGVLPILQTALVSLFIRRTLGIHTLILVAVAGALAAFEYLDAALVCALFNAAELAEAAAMVTVRRAVATTTTRLPSTVFLAQGGKAVSVDTVVAGMVIASRAGDVVMVDGVVSKGEGVLDCSALTGEASPVGVKKGDEVRSGCVVTNGYVEITASASVADSTHSKMQAAVDEVSADKGEYAKIVDQFSLYWTPCALLLTLLLVTIGGGVTGRWAEWVEEGIILLVLACPCSIVIATPIPAVCAIAVAARGGVLLRGSSVVERLGSRHLKAVGIDKTGTLTTGFFVVQELVSLSLSSGAALDAGADLSQSDPMAFAAALEEKTTHPLASAIISAHLGCIGESAGQATLPVRQVKVIDGVGVGGWVATDSTTTDWVHVVVGNERVFPPSPGDALGEKKGAAFATRLTAEQEGRVQLLKERHSSACIVFIIVDDCVEMVMALSDSVRPEGREAVAAFKALGLEVSMLTGDHSDTAVHVCQRVGIDAKTNCLSRLLPQGKLDWVALQQGTHGRGVLMVGDGINDAAALAAADVGVAMGAGGSGMAIASAEVVLLSSSLARLPWVLSLSRAARAVMLFNCTFSITIKFVALALALTGMLTLWAAILVDVGTLVLVVAIGMVPLLFKATA